MRYDLFESISQRSGRTKDSENCRIQAVCDELARRCILYESEFGTGKKDVISQREAEARVAEEYAKETHSWFTLNDIMEWGVPGPSGNENDTYIAGNTVLKVNNLLNSGSIGNLLRKIFLHNILFPESSYSFIGFAGYEGRSVMPVIIQDFIKEAVPATQIEIDTYMSAIAFEKISKGRFQNDKFEVWDILPRNVLKDREGDIFVIDAEIKYLT